MFQKCSTAGSRVALCRLLKFITRSRIVNGLKIITRATSSWSTSVKHVVGSTRCMFSPRRCSIVQRLILVSVTESCLVMTAQKCQRVCATIQTQWRCLIHTVQMRCVGICCRRQSCAAETSLSQIPACVTRFAKCCYRCGTHGTSCRFTPMQRIELVYFALIVRMF